LRISNLVLGLYGASLPLYFSLFGIGSLSRYLGILAICFFLLHLLETSGRALKPPSWTYFWLFLPIWCLMSSLWAWDVRTLFLALQTLIIPFGVYFLMVIRKFSEKDIPTIENIIVAGGVIISSIVTVSYFMGFSFEVRASIGIGGEVTDPNFLSSALLIPLAFSFQKFVSERYKILSFFFTSIIAFAIFLTGSRGVALAVLMLFLTFLLKFKRLKKLYFVAGLMLLVMSVASIWTYIPEELGHRYIFKNIIQSRGTRRFDIWIVGLNVLKKNYLLGVGYHNFPVAYNKYVAYSNIISFPGYSRVAHNLYLQVAVELGVVGLILLIISLYKHLKFSWLYCSPATTASFVGLLTAGLSLDIFNYKHLWFLMAFIIVEGRIKRAKIL